MKTKKTIITIALIALVAIVAVQYSSMKNMTVNTDNLIPEETDTQTQDSDSYIGLSLDDAISIAKEKEEIFRVVNIDGEPQPVTMDYRPGRINASTVSGIVTEYSIEGENKISKDDTSLTTEDSSYIGLTIQQAQDLADEKGELFRVVSIDGEPQATTKDLRLGRINASIIDAVVTEISIEGK